MLAESGAKLRRITHRERLDRFGSLRFRHRPVPENYENIEITDRWESANIIPIEVPAVARLRGASRTFNAGVSVFQGLGGVKGSSPRTGSFSYPLPKHRSPTWAAAYLNEWTSRAMRSRIEPMKKVATMLRKHEDLLLNYIRAKRQYTTTPWSRA